MSSTGVKIDTGSEDSAREVSRLRERLLQIDLRSAEAVVATRATQNLSALERAERASRVDEELRTRREEITYGQVMGSLIHTSSDPLRMSMGAQFGRMSEIWGDTKMIRGPYWNLAKGEFTSEVQMKGSISEEKPDFKNLKTSVDQITTAFQSMSLTMAEAAESISRVFSKCNEIVTDSLEVLSAKSIAAIMVYSDNRELKVTKVDLGSIKFTSDGVAAEYRIFGVRHGNNWSRLGAPLSAACSEFSVEVSKPRYDPQTGVTRLTVIYHPRVREGEEVDNHPFVKHVRNGGAEILPSLKEVPKRARRRSIG